MIEIISLRKNLLKHWIIFSTKGGKLCKMIVHIDFQLFITQFFPFSVNDEIITTTDSFELPIIPSCPKEKPCLTKDGKVCKFPFTYKENTYQECIKDNMNWDKSKFPGRKPKLWCFPSNSDYSYPWKSCTSGCPGLRGKYLH